MISDVVEGLPVRPRCRVILDNDWSGDPDGLVALAHHLLSPANEVVLVTSSRLAEIFVYEGGSPVDAAAFASEVIALTGVQPAPRSVAGSHAWFSEGANSPAADAIVATIRAHPRQSELPLVLVCAGPLTNVAQALRQDPDIAPIFTLVWVGGTLGDSYEYNRDTDVAAAEFVFAQRDLAITQFPLETYRKVACSIAELQLRLGHAKSALGRRLWQSFLDLPLPDFVRLGGTWALGDSCPLLLTALTAESSACTEVTASGIDAKRTVFTSVDAGLLLSDLQARLLLLAV